MLINVSTVVVLLRTPVSVSLAGEDPTAPVVSFHLLLPVSCSFRGLVLSFGQIIINSVLGLLPSGQGTVLSYQVTLCDLIFLHLLANNVVL